MGAVFPVAFCPSPPDAETLEFAEDGGGGIVVEIGVGGEEFAGGHDPA